MDSGLEATRDALITQAKSWELTFEVGKSLPKKLLHEIAATRFISVRKSVACRRGCATDGAEPAAVITQSIAHIIEAESVSELRVK